MLRDLWLKICAWTDAHLGGSWGTESVSGTVFGSLAQGVPEHWPHHILLEIGLATVASFIYELVFDPNGFEWKDVGQREPAMIFTILFFSVV